MNFISSKLSCIAAALIFFVLCGQNLTAQTISTYAGGLGDDSSAVIYARLNNPGSIALDATGSLYILDRGNYRIAKVAATTGIIRTISGNTISGSYGGDGALATASQFSNPDNLIMDRRGNMYLSEGTSILKIDTTGIIKRVAGTGTSGYSGDGAAATGARLTAVNGIAIDTSGNIYISDGTSRIRKVDVSGVINTFAGGTSSGFSGDGGQATAATIRNPAKIVVDGAGNILFVDGGNNRIRKISTSGIISTFAGTGSATYSGDGGPATAAGLDGTTCIHIDASGQLYLSNGSSVRVINTSGIIRLFAGSTSAGYSGDGGPATAARFTNITGICARPSGDILISDAGNNRIRKIDVTGIVTNLVGNGIARAGSGGDGGLRMFAQFGSGVQCMDTAGNIYSSYGNYIRKINRVTGIVSVFAGSPSPGFGGDGGPAGAALMNGVTGMTIDKNGNIYLSDQGNFKIRKINPAGIITSIAGGGTSGRGDGGPATNAQINPMGLACDTSGNIYITEPDSNRVRKITISTGIITTIAGVGGASFSGIPGPATAAAIVRPFGVICDKKGNKYLHCSSLLFKIDQRDSISPLTLYRSDWITSSTYTGSFFCLDSVDNIYFLANNSSGGASIIQLDTFGHSHLIAGTNSGYLGDGGLAIDCEFDIARGLSLDKYGNMFVGQRSEIRQICCLTTDIDQPPIFTSGWVANLSVCNGSTGNSIDSVLKITDADVGDSLKWKVYTSPSHGTLAGFIASGVTTGGMVMPTSVYYNPTAGYSGTDIFRIIVSDGADEDTITINVRVSSTPIAGSVSSSAASICAGSIATFTVAGSTYGLPGTWMLTNARATITDSGSLTGVTPGIDTVLYVVSNICGSDTASIAITILNTISSVTTSGPSIVCVGTSVTLASSVSGGTWFTADPYITVGASSGVISGVASGTAIVSYTVTNICGTASDTALITVNPAISAGVITGTSTICVGSAATLSTTGSGGTWSSSNPSIATISTSGVVTGLSGGAALLSYTVASTCGTTVAVALINVTTATSIGAITGPSSVCTGGTITLGHTTGGGTWSSSTPGVATVSASGVVTGVASGTVTISYSVSAGCGVSLATASITVNSAPSAGTLSGASSLCVGAATTLSSSVSGGIWSASSSSIATIGATGVVYGTGVGTAMLTYSVTNSCGTTIATYSLPVAPAPNAGSISGSASVCSGSSVTLSSSISGGIWNSSAASTATVSSSGIVTGLSAGMVNISYSITTGCGTDVALINITVNAPTAGTITGTTILCAGNSTALGSTVSGGSWVSSSPGVATISSSGVVTAVAAGVTIITYTVTGTCGGITMAAITVNAAPSISAITGTTSLCTGTTSTLSTTTTGGTWTSSASSIATISATGLLTGVAAGTAVISYTLSNSCGTVHTTAPVTIGSVPSAGTLSGPSSVCMAAATALTASVSGGSWSSSNISIASVNTAGNVHGVSAGTAVITYTVSTSCGSSTVTHPVTVNALPAPGAISGPASVCIGSSATLTATVTGGTWASSAPSIATISATGNVYGISTGIIAISYSLTNSCGTSLATYTVLVNPLPNSGTISGAATLCTGTGTTLTSTVSGGTWASGSAIASVSGTTGVVTGIASGTATLSYTVANSCGTAVSTYSVTISSSPTSGSISGPSVVCSGSSIILSASAGGGSWTTTTAGIATVNSTGTVTGLATGTGAITYTVSNSCGSASASHAVTVSTAPNAGTISGTATLCTGTTTTFTTTGSGGAWSSSAPTVASVDASGVIYARSAGTANISYSVTTGCGTAAAVAAITINTATAGTITGTTSICVGSTTTLSSTVSGGSWSSSTIAVATINAAGVVTSLSPGTTIISYTSTGACGSATSTVAVTVMAGPAIAAITGTTTICNGTSTALANATPGGSWSSSATTVATISATGMLYGISGGTASISYTMTGTCGSTSVTTTITVQSAPAAGTVTGTPTLCTGTTTVLSPSVTGGMWSSSTPGVATVNSLGVVTGVSAGTALISYSVTNTCGTATDTMLVTINTAASAGTITGITSLCQGSTTTLSNATTGGIWSSSNAAVATVNASGLVAGLSAGSVTISYSVTNLCGISVATTMLTVNPTPFIGAILGSTSLATGSSTTLSNAVSGGTWVSSNPSVASISTTGVITGIAAGTATITYTLTNSFGCSSDTTTSLTIVPATSIEQLTTQPKFSLFPNPTMGGVTINWQGLDAEETNVTITDAAGRIIIQEVIPVVAASGNHHVDLSNFAPGMYFFMVSTGTTTFNDRIMLQ